MGMRLGHAGDEITETHEINVTPFIDVMLVLLIIFMVTAPLSTVDIPVKLPVARAAQKPPPEKPVFVTLQADYSIAVGETRVQRAALVARIEAATGGNRDTQLFVRADKRVDYDHLMDLLNVLRTAGFLKIGLVGVGAG